MDLSIKMKNIAVIDKNKVGFLESGLPKVGPGDILVKIRGCMLCTFEQRIFNRVVKMPLPFVPGHEIVGEVAHLGDNINEKDWPIKQKVVIRLLYPCGECYNCRNGYENICLNGNRANESKNEIMGMGGLGEYISVEPRQLWKVPNDLEDEIAVFAEPLGCVVNSVQIARANFGDDVVVIGGGIMGQLHIMLAKLSGARVILSEPDEKRRAIAKKLGADITINPMEVDPIKSVKEITGNGAEVVYNTTSIPIVAKQSIEMLAPLGKVVMYSSIHPDEDITVNPNWIHKFQPIITGAMSPSVRSFDAATNLLAKKILDPRPLLFNTYKFEQAQQAFEEAVLPQTMRILIDFKE